MSRGLPCTSRSFLPGGAHGGFAVFARLFFCYTVGSLAVPCPATPAGIQHAPGGARRRADAHRARTARHAVAERPGADARFRRSANVFTTRPDEARERLERALDQAEAAITEGRDAVQGLRLSATTLNDLATSIAAIGAALTSDPSVVAAAAIEVEVDGQSRRPEPRRPRGGLSHRG